MEIDGIETVLEKIWDLHDKLSDSIHSISRAHFLTSIKAQRRSSEKKRLADNNDGAAGFVFVKDFRFDGCDDDSAIQEAKSLNAIRTALENLEDQLEIFHTVQVQQRAERDAAIARLEQSRIVLAMRLAEHQGKKYKVIEEALAFVGDVQETNRFVSPENLYDPPFSPSNEKLKTREQKRPNIICSVLVSSFNLAKNSLRLDFLGGILGNAAMVAISMAALIHLQQVANTEQHERNRDGVFSNRRERKIPLIKDSTTDIDVLLARG